jgi:hypothetical protein
MIEAKHQASKNFLYFHKVIEIPWPLINAAPVEIESPRKGKWSILIVTIFG